MSVGATTRKRIWVDLLVYPAHTLPTAAAPVLVGAALAAHDGVFAPAPVAIAFLGSWLIHIAGVFTDNHELLRRHPQVVEHADLTNALRGGTLTLNQIKGAIAACLLLVVPAAVCFWLVGGIAALVIGLIGVVASLGYAGGPFPYAKLGFAEPIFFAMFGVVAVAGTYFAQIAWLAAKASLPTPGLATLASAAFFVGLPVGALVTNVLLIDDMRDRQFDAIKGWRTVAVRFGPAGSRFAYCGLSALAYLAPFALWILAGFGAWILLPLATFPWAILIARIVLTRDEAADLAPMTAKASMLSCAYAMLLSVGIVAG